MSREEALRSALATALDALERERVARCLEYESDWERVIPGIYAELDAIRVRFDLPPPVAERAQSELFWRME